MEKKHFDTFSDRAYFTSNNREGNGEFKGVQEESIVLNAEISQMENGSGQSEICNANVERSTGGGVREETKISFLPAEKRHMSHSDSRCTENGFIKLFEKPHASNLFDWGGYMGGVMILGGVVAFPIIGFCETVDGIIRVDKEKIMGGLAMIVMPLMVPLAFLAGLVVVTIKTILWPIYLMQNPKQRNRHDYTFEQF